MLLLAAPSPLRTDAMQNGVFGGAGRPTRNAGWRRLVLNRMQMCGPLMVFGIVTHTGVISVTIVQDQLPQMS
jgi:hypothetical protein